MNLKELRQLVCKTVHLPEDTPVLIAVSESIWVAPILVPAKAEQSKVLQNGDIYKEYFEDWDKYNQFPEFKPTNAIIVE